MKLQIILEKGMSDRMNENNISDVPKKAYLLKECINTFRPYPLSRKDFSYYENTARFRSTHDYVEWHDKIFKRIECEDFKLNILFSSQTGCGKSTELNLLAKKLEENDYLVRKIEVPLELDGMNIHYIDLIMLITYKIVDICESLNIKIKKELINKIENTFLTKIIEQEDKEDYSSNAKSSIGFSLQSIISLLSKITSTINLSSSKKISYTKEIEPKMSEIILIINELVELITNENKYNDFFPIFIIDQLEKCSLEKVKDMFQNGGQALKSLNINLIMTCPLALKRSSDFNFIAEKFDLIENLPMIIVINKDGTENSDAINMLKKIIDKRVDLQLFDNNILESLIKYTGGSLRDLFYLIREASFESYLRNYDKITEDIVKICIEKMSKDIFLRIESKHYDKVHELYNNRCQLNNESDLVDLLYSGVVFEYGYQDWCDLHPLVRYYYQLNIIQ